jgi:hypothetical protein
MDENETLMPAPITGGCGRPWLLCDIAGRIVGGNPQHSADRPNSIPISQKKGAPKANKGAKKAAKQAKVAPKKQAKEKVAGDLHDLHDRHRTAARLSVSRLVTMNPTRGNNSPK